MGKFDAFPLPNNSLLFRLEDGLYSLALPSEYPPSKPMPVQLTSSYNALMRLATLDDSINDALNVRNTLTAQINKILKAVPDDRSATAQDAAERAADYVASTKKQLKASVRRRTVLLSQIHARKSGIEKGKAAQRSVCEDIDAAQGKLRHDRVLLSTTSDHIHGQRRRICEELLDVFPIEPTTTPLLFTICGIPLPNTSFDDSDVDSDDLYSAALGHVARLVDMLQYYLFVVLPYPVTAYGSRSVIADPISVLPDAQRVFPLYTKGTVRFRFDYAVFLLNKNIESLTESLGCKVIDIRHTLPNLKFLLYIGSSGEGELPSRKAGGVRGLLTGRSTSLMVPPYNKNINDGSKSSNGSPLEVHKPLDDNERDRLKQNEMVRSLSMKEDGVISLRTKGLRENVIK